LYCNGAVKKLIVNAQRHANQGYTGGVFSLLQNPSQLHFGIVKQSFLVKQIPHVYPVMESSGKTSICMPAFLLSNKSDYLIGIVTASPYFQSGTAAPTLKNRFS